MNAFDELAQLSREAREAWDRNASWWIFRIREEPGGDAFRREVLNRAIMDSVPRGRLRILDVGCGEGYLARMLAEEGATVVGLDWSLGMLKAAYRASGHHNRLSWTVGDCAGGIPFSEGAFDFVVGNMAAMDILDLERALADARRVVVRSGWATWIVLDPDGVVANPDQYFTIVREEPRRVPCAEWVAWIRIAPDQPAPTLYVHRSAATYLELFARTGWLVQKAHLLGGGPHPRALFYLLKTV